MGIRLERPQIRFLKTNSKLPTDITAEHFAAIYIACDAAKSPSDVPQVEMPDLVARVDRDGVHDRLTRRATVLAQVVGH